MRSSNIVTLFSEQPPPRTAPSSFMVSIVVHCAAFGLLLIGLRHTPQLNDEPVARRYTVRFLNPPRIEARTQRPDRSGDTQSGLRSIAHALSPGGSPAALASIPEQPTRLLPHSQTLIQPDAPPDLLLPQETPIPLIVMWSRDNSPNTTIVAPPPQEPTVAKLQPAIIKPNRESNLSDINITATRFPSQTPIIPASTTSPIVVRGPEAIKRVPETASAQVEQPSPARVVSLSDVQAQGPVAIPLANQVAQGGPGSLTAGRPDKSGAGGDGNPGSKPRGVGVGDGSGGTASAGAGAGAGAQGTGTGQGVVVGAGSGNESSVTHITLAKNGQFGVVVVGSSLAEQYPETVEVWSSRVVYTVYLHVGTGKSWILQYTLPRADEAASAGSAVRPEAPWPYDIVRPNLPPEDFNSDAILVHGFVNLAGRFEKLALVFPPGFAQAKFVLDALKQWQFRPAKQNGQLAAVEVLLIIPDETE
jgi:hypothetical protein